MKVYLCDHTFLSRQGSLWSSALDSAFGELYISEYTLGGNTPPPAHVGFGNSDAVLFVHSNGGEENWRAVAASDSTCCHIVLVRSGGRTSPERGSRANLHGCFWSAEEFWGRDLPRPAPVDRFIEAVKGCPSATTVDWTLLEAPRTELIDALRLLCEAWQATRGGPEGVLSGIRIRAPNVASDWFSALGIAPDQMAIAQLMPNAGEMKDEVEQLLSAITQERDLKQPIADFLRNFKA